MKIKLVWLGLVFMLIFLGGVGRVGAISRTNFKIEINSPLLETRVPLELPRAVSFFDLDGSGRIELTEVFATVKQWIDIWRGEGEKAKGDLNGDGKCTLVDFSILLYYVGR